MREFQNLCHKVTDEAVEVAKAQVKSTIVGQLDAGLAQVYSGRPCGVNSGGP
jgi:hypothetical protein